MQNNERQNLKKRFDHYQPSKTQLFWACAGSVVIATVIGFTWSGWVTGGTARDMAENAAAQGRQQVAAVACVDRFMVAADADTQLVALKEISSSYQRGKFVEDGGWAIMRAGSGRDSTSAGPSSSPDQREAAELCAEELITLDIPVSGEAELINDEAPAAQ